MAQRRSPKPGNTFVQLLFLLLVKWEQLVQHLSVLWAEQRLLHTLPPLPVCIQLITQKSKSKQRSPPFPLPAPPQPKRVLWPKCNLAKIMTSNSSLNRLSDTCYGSNRDSQREREIDKQCSNENEVLDLKSDWDALRSARLGWARPVDSLFKVRAYAFCSACLVIKLSTCRPSSIHLQPPTTHQPSHATCNWQLATCNWQLQKATPC